MEEFHKYYAELKEVRHRRVICDLHKLQKQALGIYALRIQDSG